jgi:photosystem II stability/assembly factor-like uncharacterized protein
MKEYYMKYLAAFILQVFMFCNVTSQAQWVQTSGANGSTIRGFAINGAGIFGCYTARYDSAGVIRSSDYGSNWSNVSTGLPQREIDFIFATGSNLFAAENDAGVYRSTDNGASWTSSGIAVAYIYRMAAIGANLFAGDANNGILTSTDNGTNWTTVNNGLTNTQIRALFVTGSSILAGTRGGGLFQSTNNGANWTAMNSGLNKYVYAIEKIGSNLFAGTGNAGVFLSTNNGASWTAVNNGLPIANPIYALVVSGTNLFAGTYGGGIYLSTNNGSNWAEVNTGLTYKGIQALMISGSYIYAGADLSGVWRRPLSEMITGVERSSELPAEFKLSQNYPNPWNPSTIIKYTIPKTSRVILKLYDITGKVIKTLVNEEKTAGNYELTIKAGNLPSGVYFYRIQAGSFVQTKKMILIK